MRTFITTLLLSLTLVTVSAQNNRADSEHLVFKGVPINGTLDEFTKKLVETGLELVKTEDYISALTGSFAGYNECLIFALSSEKNDVVFKTAVAFPYREKWNTLFNNYSNLKEMLTKKYGEPLHSVEEFNTPTEPEDDQTKFRYTKLDKSNYLTVWIMEEGLIELSIKNTKNSDVYVELAYFDEINTNLKESSAMDDL